jgi:hypothetical protein
MTASRTAVCGRKPVLRVCGLAACVAEERETQIQKRDQHDRGDKNKQRERLIPLKQSERNESAEYDTRSNRDAAMPQPFLVCRGSAADPKPRSDSKPNPLDHEHGNVRCHRIGFHRPSHCWAGKSIRRMPTMVATLLAQACQNNQTRCRSRSAPIPLSSARCWRSFNGG